MEWFWKLRNGIWDGEHVGKQRIRGFHSICDGIMVLLMILMVICITWQLYCNDNHNHATYNGCWGFDGFCYPLVH